MADEHVECERSGGDLLAGIADERILLRFPHGAGGNDQQVELPRGAGRGPSSAAREKSAMGCPVSTVRELVVFLS
ncbi:hypothetical protein ACFV97_14060 [Streptomyces sp. NPDC059913]|uniref:hypothetical protein n=1 Tax=unclassified Streptomyces TaxID=2593676 RepID=UPI0036482CA8